MKIIVDALKNDVAQLLARCFMGLDTTFKFRLSRSLLRRANRVRKLRQKSKSEFGREAMLEHVERNEKEFNLEPWHVNGKAVAA